MSSHAVDDLVGRTFYASIAEPWDFESDAGQNKLEGTIQRALFDRYGNVLLLCQVVPFFFATKRIDEVVAVNRYQGSQDVLDALRAKGTATLNFMFQRSGGAFQDGSIEISLSDRRSCGFVVGTMHLP